MTELAAFNRDFGHVRKMNVVRHLLEIIEDYIGNVGVFVHRLEYKWVWVPIVPELDAFQGGKGGQDSEPQLNTVRPRVFAISELVKAHYPRCLYQEMRNKDNVSRTLLSLNAQDMTGTIPKVSQLWKHDLCEHVGTENMKQSCGFDGSPETKK